MIIKNVQLYGYSTKQTLVVENDFITSIQPSQPEEKYDLDVQGDYISLGGVDLQINGGLGLAFPDLTFGDLDKLHDICAYLWHKGIDIFCPTIVTTSIAKIHQSLAVINKFIQEKQHSQEAQIIGVHLEGPFLNYEKRGAHPSQYLLPLTLDNLQQIIAKYQHIIKIITLAPELDTTKKIIPYLKSLGIIVSLGHSQATATEAKTAFSLGASMVTHAFNAMPSLHHRQPGLLGEAIINKDVYCGLIADGNHVVPTMLKLILEASHYERGIFLVSDALSPIGLEDGFYPWDERTIEVTNGTARLSDGTLSGTTLSLLDGAENLLKLNICRLPQAIALVTESPRKAIGLQTLQIGSSANLIRWHWQNREQKLSWQRL
jgi:N-acetylglucosamine-6-phosphate deacetylase